MVSAEEAHKWAVRELCKVAQTGLHGDAEILAFIAEVLWERTIQEAVANELEAWSARQVVSLVNSRQPTYVALRKMKDDFETYGSLFHAHVLNGVQIG